MRHSNHGSFQHQTSFLRRQFFQDGELPFSDVLSEGIVAQALTALQVYWVDRIYSPLVTLWVFLGQVLSADHSCRAAVARLVAHRVARGQRPCFRRTRCPAPQHYGFGKPVSKNRDLRHRCPSGILTRAQGLRQATMSLECDEKIFTDSCRCGPAAGQRILLGRVQQQAAPPFLTNSCHRQTASRTICCSSVRKMPAKLPGQALGRPCVPCPEARRQPWRGRGAIRGHSGQRHDRLLPAPRHPMLTRSRSKAGVRAERAYLPVEDFGQGLDGPAVVDEPEPPTDHPDPANACPANRGHNPPADGVRAAEDE